MLWQDQSIHVLDFEGTNRTGVIEYGVVTLRGGTIESTSTGLCTPRSNLESSEINIHGISNEMLLGTMPFENNWEQFSSFRATGLLAAHHASVEDNLLRVTWPYPRVSENQKFFSWGPWIDTRRIYSSLYKGLESYGLTSLVSTFTLDDQLLGLATQRCPSGRRKAHCALFDALASALLLLRLTELPELRTGTIDWLLAISAPDRKRREELEQGDFFAP